MVFENVTDSLTLFVMEYHAIMLDGGGPSEMVAKNALGQTIVFPADQTRGIPEIITLKNPN